MYNSLRLLDVGVPSCNKSRLYRTENNDTTQAYKGIQYHIVDVTEL